jgi:Holliday junction resolvase RusA-like endonuclease
MDPWEHWRQIERFTRDVGDYDFPIYTQPKERAWNGRSKIKTRTWESMVSEAAAEDAPENRPTGRLRAQLLFISKAPKGDLSNAIKSVEDALNRRAYGDDRQIDAIEALRVYGPTLSDRVLVRLFERG